MRASRRRAADRGSVDVERIVVWLAALALASAVVGVVAYADERPDEPDAEFDVTFDEETRTITVEHAGGEAIRDRTTGELSVVVLDASTGNSERVVWASDGPGPSKRGTGYPVTQGDELAVDDPSVDADGDENYHDANATVGFHLEANDTVRVVWNGSQGATRNFSPANATTGS